VALQRGEYDYPVDMRGRDELALWQELLAHARVAQSYVRHLKNLDQAKSTSSRWPDTSRGRR
jgi:hypothetical protein